MKRAVWIPVVTGLIRKGDLILIGQRPEGNLEGQWEFPGGKIEIGELPEVALARELSEELGITAEIGSLRLAHTHNYGDRGIVMLFYDVLFWKGEPKSKHHIELMWVKPEDIGRMEIPEANRKVLPKILDILKSPAR